VVSVGQMATGRGVAFVTVALAALAVGIVGDTLFTMATHGSYALHDAQAPFRAMRLRTLVSVAVMSLAFVVSRDRAVLLVVGAAVGRAWYVATPRRRYAPALAAPLGIRRPAPPPADSAPAAPAYADAAAPPSTTAT